MINNHSLNLPPSANFYSFFLKPTSLPKKWVILDIGGAGDAKQVFSESFQFDFSHPCLSQNHLFLYFVSYDIVCVNILIYFTLYTSTFLADNNTEFHLAETIYKRKNPLLVI